ncbi:hypothetical protein QYE76_025239 [Lolium multiflorum]|uniref:Integrase catalytic domain-containing protein n=1 Tax=Lolium multiflorum TaxID=4521 RepID=A0AAD8RGJ7_LOLMU|nr:hypothetical protein QYE76_025239 [Lolium multiflorum]
MAETTPSSSPATVPQPNPSVPPTNPLDPNLQTPIRAPPTPHISDAFNLRSLTDALSVVTTAGLPNPTALPYHFFPTPISHPILSIHISDYIKFQVSTDGANYSKWRQIITSLLTMYKALDHITAGAAPAAPDDNWQAVDIHVSLWFLSTLSDDLHRLVQGTDGRALSTWTRLEGFFLDRSTARYLYLSKAFHNCPRGDLTVSSYASKLQGLADDLATVGRPVDDRDLTATFLDGLGGKFKLQATILKNGTLPSFADACSRIKMAEIDINTEQQQADSQVLVAHGGERPQPPAAHGADRNQQGNHGGAPRTPGVSPNYRGKNPIPGFVGRGGGGQPTWHDYGCGRGNSPGGGRGHSDTPFGRGGGHTPWYGYFAPVGVPFPPRASWIPPNAHGVLGPRPGAPTQVYPAIYSTTPSAPPQQYPVALPSTPAAPTVPQQHPPATANQPTSWDYNAMLQNAPSYGSAFQQYGGEWIMDSGATSHVTGNQVILDDYSHYSWVFPLRAKSETCDTLLRFFSFVTTQYNTTIRCMQSDNGGEFLTTALRNHFSTHGVSLRLSCPYTSPQNGRAERLIRTHNDIVRTLLFQASLPSHFWVEALYTANHLLNLRPSRAIHNNTPHFILYGTHPTYDHLRTFGCLCFPNLASTAAHKLEPRSTRCVFLGYPREQKGYRCYDLTSRRVIISRHVVFDESQFPYASTTPVPSQPPTTAVPHPPDPIPLGSRTISVYPTPPTSLPPTTTPPAPPAHPAPPLLPIPRAAPDRAETHARSPLSAPHDPTTPAPTHTDPVSPSPSNPTESTSCPTPTSLSPTPANPSLPPQLTLPPKSIPVIPPSNAHKMTTRSKHGFFQPKQHFNLTVSADISPLPSSYRAALKDPRWHDAMLDEFNALIRNDTWSLVPCPAGVNVVSGKWIYRHKYNSDGSLARYKARWVLRGFTQQAGIDFGETFSPVVKPATIRVVLSIATSHNWPIHQLDVKNAFLHGELAETVYCAQPSGFVDPTHPSHVCLLKKSLYGLKQAPRTWFLRFTTFLHSLGFVSSKSDSSLLILHTPQTTAYLLLYVDDIILTASSTTTLHHVIQSLNREFAMSDLGDIHHFLGINVHRTATGLFLSQQQYALELLERAHMLNCNPIATPLDTKAKLSCTDGTRVSNPTEYRSLAGALQYLTLTRPDLSHAVQQICLFMHDPRDNHLQQVKRILRYVQGTSHLGLQLRPSSTTDLTAYSDADWAGCPDTRKSTSGFCVFLGDNPVSWSSKRQSTVSRSSAEAEYRAVANCVAESVWLRQLLSELHQPVKKATVVYCDNISAVYMSANPVQHQRTKHIEIDLHFVRDRVALGEARVLHVPTSSQYADIFTKGLPSAVFQEFRSSLNVLPDPISGHFGEKKQASVRAIFLRCRAGGGRASPAAEAAATGPVAAPPAPPALAARARREEAGGSNGGVGERRGGR